MKTDGPPHAPANYTVMSGQPNSFMELKVNETKKTWGSRSHGADLLHLTVHDSALLGREDGGGVQHGEVFLAEAKNNNISRGIEIRG